MFPCRPGGPLEGRPLEAHCRCERPAPQHAPCLQCGKWDEQTVRDTFARQARSEARGQRNVVVLDDYRDLYIDRDPARWRAA